MASLYEISTLPNDITDIITGLTKLDIDTRHELKLEPQKGHIDDSRRDKLGEIHDRRAMYWIYSKKIQKFVLKK
jgi:hypothetical protein